MSILKAFVTYSNNGRVYGASGSIIRLARNHLKNIQLPRLGDSIHSLSNIPNCHVRLEHPKHWDRVALKNKSRLPKSPGIYAVIDDEYIYYIGLSTDINDRWGSHHRYPQALELSNPFIAYKRFPKDSLKQVEAQYINRLNPLWNDTPVPKIRTGEKRQSFPVGLAVKVTIASFFMAVIYAYPWVLLVGFGLLFFKLGE